MYTTCVLVCDMCVIIYILCVFVCDCVCLGVDIYTSVKASIASFVIIDSIITA